MSKDKFDKPVTITIDGRVIKGTTSQAIIDVLMRLKAVKVNKPELKLVADNPKVERHVNAKTPIETPLMRLK